MVPAGPKLRPNISRDSKEMKIHYLTQALKTEKRELARDELEIALLKGLGLYSTTNPLPDIDFDIAASGYLRGVTITSQSQETIRDEHNTIKP